MILYIVYLSKIIANVNFCLDVKALSVMSTIFLAMSFSTFQVYAVISILIVILSITVVMVETLPYFGSIYAHSKSNEKNFTSAQLKDAMNIFKSATTPLSILLLVDNICNIYFLCELLLKFIAAPYKRRFLITPFTLIEFACLIPYYVAVTIVFTHPNPIDVFDIVRLLLALRVMRIFRIFILMKHFMALKVLMYTMKASTNELFLLLLVVILGVVIFACLVYYMEIFSNEDSDFEHIPLAFWWALITMTTVGYGDMTPSTGLGYAVGSLCAISGVLVIALSVPAIVQNFTLYYTHAQSRSKLKQRKRKYRQARWTKITELLKSKMGNSDKPSLLNIVKLAQNNKLRRKTVFVPSTSNGHAPQPKDQRSHSVADPITKKDISALLQKRNTNLKNDDVFEEKPTPSEEKKTKFVFPGLKIKRNQVASASEENQSSQNENLDREERRKSNSSSHLSESDVSSPKTVRWATLTDGVKTSKNVHSKDAADEVDSGVNEIHSPSTPVTPLPTLQEDNEADISNSENENDKGESCSGLERMIKHDKKYRNIERESESSTGADREEKRRRKNSDKGKRKRKNSDSEYESSSGKDDDLLDEAYEEMKFVHRNSIISIEVEKNPDEQTLSRDRSNSIN
jgi:hypothetical protein